MNGDRAANGSIGVLVASAAAAMRERWGVAPVAAAQAPGRVNLIGEHTDYNGGFVLPIAIDRACVAAGAPARDPTRSRIVALDLGETVEVDLRRGVEPARDVAGLVDGVKVRIGTWPSYVLGVAAVMAERARARHFQAVNVDVAVTSSVPLGSGLSSSASLEVATASLLGALWGVALSPMDTARTCRRAEHEFAGVPCGIMDQYISAMGREDHALLIDCRAETAEAVPMPGPDRAVVLVMNTGVHHALASGEYARRREQCRGAAAKLGVADLRDVTLERVLAGRAGLSEVEFRRARHVVTENARVVSAAAALRGGELGSFGRLMDESHESLREDYEVSCAELDTLVESARAVPGVFGARMTGGGFGGCAIALAEPGAAGHVGARVAQAYRRVHGRECTIFVTRARAGCGPCAIS